MAKKIREPTFYSDAMTWLNGRAVTIIITANPRNNDEKNHVILFRPSMEMTIEDCIHQYCEKNSIDILEEICGEGKHGDDCSCLES